MIVMYLRNVYVFRQNRPALSVFTRVKSAVIGPVQYFKENMFTECIRYFMFITSIPVNNERFSVGYDSGKRFFVIK